MSLRRFLSVLGAAVVVALACAGAAPAQTADHSPYSTDAPPMSGDSVEAATRGTSGVTLAGPVDPQHYRLGPGDILRLEFGGRASGSRNLVVDGEGKVRAPSLGVVTVGGKYLADVRSDLLQKLTRYFPGAVMDLRLVQPRRFNVFALGEVKTPGLYVVTGSARVSEVLDQAGGLRPGAGSRTVTVLRRDGSSVVADLESFRWTGAWSSNPYLEDGDRILVPTRTRRVGAFGGLARPGWIEYRPGDSLTTIVGLAGGLLPKALANSVLVVRFEGATALESLYVDVGAITAGRASDIALEPEDRVYVTVDGTWHAGWQVSIEGEVQHPGPYAIREETDRVSDLLRWAGGLTDRAARKNVQLIRRNANEGPDIEFERLSKLSRTEMTETEYNAFRSKLALRQSIYLVDFSMGSPQPPATDVLLRDGDVIRVPRLELAVRVDGSVRHPGLVSFAEGLSFREYVRMAGGTTDHANMGQAQLTRFGTNETHPAKDIARIEPGDFIYVPEKKETSVWSVVKDVIAVAGQVATIVIVIDTFSRR